MEEVPIFSEEAMDRIGKAIRDLEDMKTGFPELVRQALPDILDDVVTINVIEVTDDLELSPGYWPGIVHVLEDMDDVTAEPEWGVLQLDSEVSYDEDDTDFDYDILVVPLPNADGTPGTLKAGMYVGVLWGVSEPTGADDEEPETTEVYLAVGVVGATTGGGVVIRAGTAGSGPITAQIQTVDGSGNLIDDTALAAISVRKFSSPLREDFLVNGIYPAYKIGAYYYAETGPATICTDVVTKDSIGHLDCSTLQITYTNTTKIRTINRACP